MIYLRNDKMVNENEAAEPIEEEEVAEPAGHVKPFRLSEMGKEEEEEQIEEEEEVDDALMTLGDVKDRFIGIVDNARAAGLATVTNRGFAAVESFFGALAGDKEKRPPKR